MPIDMQPIRRLDSLTNHNELPSMQQVWFRPVKTGSNLIMIECSFSAVVQHFTLALSNIMI